VKHCGREDCSSQELTWEEKNPISYFYYSSDAIERLKEMLKTEKVAKTFSHGKKGNGKKGNFT
jgi:hypothetical protein